MKKLLITLILLLPLSLLAQIAGQSGDFSFRSGLNEWRNDHLYVEISGKVGFNHLLYRDRMSFSAPNGRLEIDWPTTKMKKDPFTGEDVAVYADGSHNFAIRFFPATPSVNQLDLQVNYQGCSNITCFFPTKDNFKFSFNPTSTASKTPSADSPFLISTASSSSSASELPGSDSSKNGKVQTPSGLVDFAATMKEHGIFWVLVMSLLGGLLVSLTPCVYPMIPITLSIIGGRNENQSFFRGLGLSATYVAGLSLTYALLGLAAASFGAQIRGFLQGTFFQAAISLIFFILALSMFDVFMIQAPAALRNRLGNVKRTGMIGIFAMGMVSGLMASPCVAAPLAGILAFIAATGSQFLGFFMLLLFAWGMSVPLLLIGAFSGSLNSLPKAGDWMNRVKEFYGFLMIGAALYFARPLIGEPLAEMFLALVLAAFAAFLGLFSNLPEDSLLSHRILKAFGIVTIAVACAFAISATTKWGYLCMPQTLNSQTAGKAELIWLNELDSAISKAKAEKKPVFMDFRADWCPICRELEKNVFPRPEIKVLLEKMVLVKVDATSSNEKTDALLKNFGVVGLPTLVILSSDGNELTELRMVGDVTPALLAGYLSKALH